MEEKFIKIHDKDVVLAGENATALSRSIHFLDWLNSFDPNLEINWILEEWSCWKKSKDLIFAMILYQYVDEFGKGKKTLLFFRSDSSAVFLVLKDIQTEEKYIVLVEQVRGPVGGKILEIPAGTLESSENPAETMAREVGEEVNLSVKSKDLISLGTYYFSPGACSEKITLYMCELVLPSNKINGLKDYLAGLKEHGEITKVKLFSFDEFEKLDIYDAKTKLAYELYKNKKINP